MRLYLRTPLVFWMMSFFCLAAQAQSSRQGEPRWEIGGHYTLLNIAADRTGCAGCRVKNSGLGLNFGFNFRPWIGLDSEINFFPDPGSGATNQEGGRMTQGLFGVKLGVARKRWSLFGKVRPGFVSNGRAIVGVSPTPAPFTFTFGRLTHFTTDFGGIVAYHISRRVSLRTDLGDTIVRHGAQTTTSITGSTLTVPTFYAHNFQWSTGVIIRF